MTRPDAHTTLPEVIPLVVALYMSPGGSGGCCLHIVLDDFNVDDYSVTWCVDYAKERGHKQCERLGRILYGMSQTQRTKLAAMPKRAAP